ncbi:MAG: AAA family ATPase [Candidatus Liberibacter europaeus]|uniref:ADP,ATP carrier protein n=1 Tax=Candidatus Liberibacter europaeus TaxID=744859 RepID=A0A2T4VXV6_9HYPH|nr:AAA family ATPase [Candidatus Liberibacter europaeus]PTL86607.1 MAG: AAA family ATPase [Candidatus Liberibacter europaeus]
MSRDKKILDVLLGLWRVLCPVKMSEAKKFIPMTTMMFLVLFNFSTLRPLKDSLVVPNIGAEVISFVKLWLVLPSAVLFTIIYMKLANILDSERLFYLVTSFFISFFAIFAFVLYPYGDWFHPSPKTISDLELLWPSFKWFIRLSGKWSYGLFYVFAELWGAVMINLMFWQFANKITKTEEAKRFYATFGLVGNVGLIFSGAFIQRLSKQSNETLISHSMIAMILSSVLLVAIYRWMHVYVLTDPRYYSPKEGSIKKKLKLSVLESVKMALQSRYICYIVLLVLCYGITINLVEGPWKDKVRTLYPDQGGYANFMGQFVQWTGIVTIMFMILGSNILRHFRWFTSAIITPLMILVTGGGFFLFVLFDNEMRPFTDTFIKMTPLALAVFLGTLQNILSKATKYTMFDATKEMVFIPLDDESRTKGKAVVDIVGGRIAKSGGAVFQSLIFMLFPMATFSGIVPVLTFIFLFFMIIWFFSVNMLSKEYYNRVGKN